jgi:hypothetical protein
MSRTWWRTSLVPGEPCPESDPDWNLYKRIAEAAVEEKVVEEVSRLSCNASNFDGQFP